MHRIAPSGDTGSLGASMRQRSGIRARDEFERRTPGGPSVRRTLIVDISGLAHTSGITLEGEMERGPGAPEGQPAGSEPVIDRDTGPPRHPAIGALDQHHIPDTPAGRPT